jgi:beta-glucuronidase
MSRRPVIAVLAVVVAATAAVAAPSASAQVTAPSPVPASRDGAGGRYLLDGPWLLRVDRRDRGAGQHWERRRSTAGWIPITVPNAWNANDRTPSGFIGAPAWYRKDFRLPSRARSLDWRVHFDSVNYRATVWLNGRLVGRHAGGFIAFTLPLAGLKRRGVNRLVVRTDNRRLPTDFPPTTYTRTDEPRGGWWNYGGIVREVYLQRVDRIDLERVVVRPSVPCPTCPVSVRLITVVRNVSSRRLRARVRANFGGLGVRMGTVAIAPGGRRTLSRRIPVAGPHLWTPATPYLYPVTFSASAASRGALRRAARYTVNTGLRSVRVRADGRLLLNGLSVNLRGVAIHEDLPGKGPAWTDADRSQTIAQIKDTGSTLVRSHYPLSPSFQEMADRAGLLIWSEVPVYRMNNGYLFASTRRAAVAEVRQNILDNENHPSVIVWSIGNELQDRVPARVRRYISAAARTAKGIDPTRPVGMAIEGHPLAGCRPGYGPLDVIGINDYFGWYDGEVANRDDLSPYLDQVRACHPTKALLVTEFGAEANRDGPVTEKGTFEFQQDLLKFHLGVFDTKPWLSGAVWFTLREFLVRPGWDGGNPIPNPPFHQKAVISYDGTVKPAYYDLQAAYRATQQYPAPAP